MEYSNFYRNTMIYDKDLNYVLESSTNDDLQILVEYITKRFSQTLTQHQIYKEYQPNHIYYIDLIAAELREMGGNTIFNTLRGGVGPTYYEIVCDVANELNVSYEQGSNISVIEKAILESFLEQVWENMNEKEKQEILNKYKNNHIQSGGLTTISLLTIFRVGGFASYQFAVILANKVAHLVLGHGLSLAANASLTKTLSVLTGPVGWIISGIWTFLNITGIAYTVTIPCVIHIAMLRMKIDTLKNELYQDGWYEESIELPPLAVKFMQENPELHKSLLKMNNYIQDNYGLDSKLSVDEIDEIDEIENFGLCDAMDEFLKKNK